jgi:hypothetical protein
MNLRWAWVALLSVVCISVASAQDEGAGPATAFGGGRMVRGTITAVAPDRLTLKTEAGDLYQIAVTPNTQVRKGRDPMKLADVHVGDGAGAMGVLDAPNKTVHAMVVSVVDQEQIRKARESMGKTWIAGKVTAIDELKLTIQRQDNVSQVIQVDEDTSFRKGGRGMRGMMGGGGPEAMPMGPMDGGGRTGGPGGGGQSSGQQGESITLADIKVGDMVAGQGALKSGVFVPTQLAVMEPGARGGGRRRGPGGTGDGNGAGASAAPAEPK